MRPSLEYFLYIAKYNNITRAANELHITQQSLSNYLKRLEEYYGVPLFTRKPVLALTAFGQSVFDRARIIDNIYDEIDASRIYNQIDEPVKVGFTIIHIYQAMKLLDIRRFQETHKDICFTFRHNTLQTLSQLLAARELDLYFASYVHAPVLPTPDMNPSPDFLSKNVGKYHFNAIVHQQLLHDYFGSDSDGLIEKWKAGVSLAELSRIPLILLRQLRNPVFLDAQRNNYSLHLKAESDNVHLAMEMVAEGLGFSIIPVLSNQPHSEFLQFPISAPQNLQTRDIVCCTTEFALNRKVVKDLWDMIGPMDS